MPEKQTVEDQCRSAATVAKPLNSTRRTWTTLEYRPSLRPLTDGPGRLAHSHGSEGRARCVLIGWSAVDHHRNWRTRGEVLRPGQ